MDPVRSVVIKNFLALPENRTESLEEYKYKSRLNSLKPVDTSTKEKMYHRHNIIKERKYNYRKKYMKMFVKASKSEEREIIPTDSTIKNKLRCLNKEVKQKMESLDYHTKEMK